MFCSQCGTKMEDTANACPNCGKVVASPAPQVEAAAPVENPVTPVAPAPKLSAKQKMIAVIACCAAALLLIVGIVALVLTNTPEAKLLSALNNTGDAFNELLDSSDNLMDALDHLESIGNKKAFTLKADLDIDQYQRMLVSTQINYNLGKKQASGEANLTMGYGLQSNGMTAQFSADKEQLILGFPQVLSEEYYSIPTLQLGEKLRGSTLSRLLELEDVEGLDSISLNLFADLSMDAFLDTDPEAYAVLTDSLDVKKTEKTIDGAEGKVAYYTVDMDWNAISRLAAQYVEYACLEVMGSTEMLPVDFDDMFANMFDEKPEVIVGIRDKHIAAVSISIDGDALILLLQGEGNICSDMKLTADGRTLANLTVAIQDQGFLAEIFVGGQIIRLQCQDDVQKLIADMGFVSYSINYGAEDKGAQLQFDIAGVDCRISILPVEKIVQLSKKPVSVLDMTQAELQKLLLKFVSFS